MMNDHSIVFTHFGERTNLLLAHDTFPDKTWKIDWSFTVTGIVYTSIHTLC